MSLLSPSGFRDLVSGRRPGVTAVGLRLMLRMVEVPYAAAMRWRNRQYDLGKKPIHRVDVPVISIGNLTLGGTGKTPLVECIAGWFQRRGTPITLISRGYGTAAGKKNDEALELEQKLPDVPHIQNPDRVAAAQLGIAETNCRAILLDDAFQHRRIHRDLNLVLLDALEPFGFDHVFPRGTLREPVAGLRRADVVLLARADMLPRNERAEIHQKALSLAPEAIWGEVTHAPKRLVSADGGHKDLESLAEQRVAAFCAIGNPSGFRHTLDTCGYKTVAFREFPDHHAYTEEDTLDLAKWAIQEDVSAVLCTWKDLVKLKTVQIGSLPLWAVAIELNFLAGWKPLEERLTSLLPSQ